MKNKNDREDQSGSMIRTLWVILVAIFLQSTLTGDPQNRLMMYMLMVVVCCSLLKNLVSFIQKATGENEHSVDNEDVTVV